MVTPIILLIHIITLNIIFTILIFFNLPQTSKMQFLLRVDYLFLDKTLITIKCLKYHYNL